MWLTEIAVTPLRRIDILILGLVVTPSELGRYTLALLLIQPVGFLVLGIYDAATPRMVVAGDRQAPDVRPSVRSVTRLTFVAAVPVAGLVLLFSPVTPTLVGSDFTGIPLLVALLLPSELLPALLGPSGQLLNLAGGERHNAAITWIAVISSLGLFGLVALLGYGVHGAAVAKTMTTLLIAILTNLSARRLLGFAPALDAWGRSASSKP